MCASLAPGTRFTLAIYRALVTASAGWSAQVAEKSIELLLLLFEPRWHGATDPLTGFIDYLREGFAAGTPPGPLFDAAFYLQRAQAAGLPPPGAGESPVMHWLAAGCPARIVPTRRFDEEYYRARNLDIAGSADWGFVHFLRNGIAEGRLPKAEHRFRHAHQELRAASLQMRDLQDRWYEADFPHIASASPERVPQAAQQQLEDVLASPGLREIYRQVQAIEPLIGELAEVKEYLLLPYYDELWSVHAAARQRLPALHYDSIICVPWIRTGGADLVAGLLAKSLLRIRPRERVLVLRTDNPHLERSDWMPEAVDVVDISDLAARVQPQQAEQMLRIMFRGVAARRVFNVNSRLCWNALQNYGANLAATLRTYSYLFCWDQTPTGLRVGYRRCISRETIDTITAFLTDTDYLKNELTRMYRLPQQAQDRLVALHTPAQIEVRVPSIARQMLERGEPDARKLVLWGGRLDRQKRFDLVQEIARRMPDVDFRCWGAALLDAPPDLAALPANVTMQGSFESFDQLPLAQAGAWLFTAGWEGMPTTIIELATRGMVIVASAVGGVPELIRSETGWPVAADADVDDYVATLRSALERPEEAMRRAEALQRLVASTYTQAGYDAALHALLVRESA